jgi:hypothetical protein
LDFCAIDGKKALRLLARERTRLTNRIHATLAKDRAPVRGRDQRGTRHEREPLGT